MLRQIALKLFVILAPLLALAPGAMSRGQVRPAAISGGGPGLTGYVSFGGLRTHVNAFTYNALGVDAGLYVQRSPFVGVEVRGGTYPMYARYSQTPITAGWRGEIGNSRVQPIVLGVYAGAGMSKAQDAGPHYVATPAAWDPCWQVSQAMIMNMGPWRWKVYEGTLTETYTSQRSLRGLSVTTGFVYSFRGLHRRRY